MRIYKSIFTIVIFFISVFFIVFPSDVVSASKSAILLWGNIVLPALFPFLILSDLITHSSIPDILSKLFSPVMRPIFKLPGVSSLALILGMAGGYPVGAKVTTNLRKKKLLSDVESKRLIAFSNNAGPLFLSGAIGIGLYKSTKIGFLLMLAHYLSAIIVGIIFRFYKKTHWYPAPMGPNGKKGAGHLWPRHLMHEHSTFWDFKIFAINLSKFSEALTLAIKNSVVTVTVIGGFIVLFSIISTMLEKTGVLTLISNFLMPNVSIDISKSIIVGIMEVTNGVNKIAALNAATSLKLILTSGIIGFGGFSVHMQTLSVISGSDIGVGTYLIGKILQGILASTLTFFLTAYTTFSAVPVFSGVEYNSVGFFKLLTVINLAFVFSVIFKIVQTFVYSKKQ